MNLIFSAVENRFVTLIFFFFLIFSYSTSHSQPTELLPTIGLDNLPGNSEDICDIPLRLNPNFAFQGVQIGDAFTDFTFFNINGDSVNLEATLELGKPVVLITCSYTCYVFRDQLQAIKDLQTNYGDQVTILLMYIIEAHPYTDINPYFGYVNPSFQNLDDSILYNEPLIYGDRIATATAMIADLDIDIPVILDGPCNEFWTWSVCGPNTAYLIDTNGIIATKHGWFNNQNQNMGCSIDSLLGNPSECGQAATGQISFELTSDVVIHGVPGETIFFSGLLTNIDSAAATVDIIVTPFIFPDDWLYALCADICYPPLVDSVSVIVSTGQVINFVFDMITSEIEKSGLVKVEIKNHYHPDEVFSFNLKGITDSSLVSVNAILNSTEVEVYPNPASDHLFISSNADKFPALLRIVDVYGKEVKIVILESALQSISVAELPAGIYLLSLKNDEMIFEKKIIISN
jgi:hypothetical protein